MVHRAGRIRGDLDGKLRRAFQETWSGIKFTVIGVVRLLQGRIGLSSVSGPITIYDIAGQAGAKGTLYFAWAMALISINIGLINLLPIPILDGGAILTLLIETVMGRDLSLNVKEAMLKVGFVFLMMLMVFVIYNDIAKRFTPGLLLRAGQTAVQRR